MSRFLLVLRAMVIIAFAFTLMVLVELWESVRCRTGRHRETVVSTPCGGGLLGLICLDCLQSRPLCRGIVFTPSRRYAVLRRPKHGRAA